MFVTVIVLVSIDFSINIAKP